MFLASFFHDGAERIGFRGDGEHLIDIAAAAAAYPDILPWVPADMQALIASGPEMMSALQRLFAEAARNDALAIPFSDVRWRPPVRRPGKIVGVAMNNSASDARKIKAPDHPMFFLKPASALIGHLEPIVVRSYYGGVHPEPELAVVIGARTHRVDPRSALDHVFGYTILNDLTGNVMRGQDMVHYYALYASADDPEVLERREQHLSYAARYKGTDGFGPIGPWIATRDDIADPGALDVICSVGGAVIAEDSTRYLTYNVAEILAFLSRFHTLEPGDIVSMG
ncbi:MAG TPA: fumarylacetoacetate hydrolase family protein, partial [Sphingomonas sp.]|nr:fumarylacetoacetate hydrolase family protein [Sphingomonas sp.]